MHPHFPNLFRCKQFFYTSGNRSDGFIVNDHEQGMVYHNCNTTPGGETLVLGVGHISDIVKIIISCKTSFFTAKHRSDKMIV